MLIENIQGCWLTLNRQCNLRCAFCYASSTGFRVEDAMSLTDAKKAIELVYSLGIKYITLIGGEPTCYNYLFKVIALCKEREIHTTLVTNGLFLADNAYLEKLILSGISNIGLSMKAYSANSYKDVTGVDAFSKVKIAMSNLAERKIPFSVSMVLTPDNINCFIEGIRVAKDNGAKSFSLSFCYDFSVIEIENEVERNTFDFAGKMFKIIDSFIAQYNTLCEVTDNKFSLSQSFPLCAWQTWFIDKLVANNQIKTVCQLLKHSGLIFDADLSLIPCNAMHTIKLGKLGKDFQSPTDFEQYWNSSEIENIFDRLRSLPSENCKSCDKQALCGGGCVSNWFNYSYDEFIKAKAEYYVY
jgi:radical SAM protein with 4Fe4S-binding SPASM domain